MFGGVLVAIIEGNFIEKVLVFFLFYVAGFLNELSLVRDVFQHVPRTHLVEIAQSLWAAHSPFQIQL